MSVTHFLLRLYSCEEPVGKDDCTTVEHATIPSFEGYVESVRRSRTRIVRIVHEECVDQKFYIGQRLGVINPSPLAQLS